MASKIFLLGRPGSGKSAAARYIRGMAEADGWDTVHINDYKFLKQMYEIEGTGKRFQASSRGGFDVLDFSVLDLALQMVEEEALDHCPYRKELVLVEFARNDYHAALRLFSRSFLQDAYLLFFHVDLNVCARRVQERTEHPESVDDHFISEEMLRNYYERDSGRGLVESIVEELELQPKRVGFIENMGSKQDFCQKVQRQMEAILCEESRALAHSCGQEGREEQVGKRCGCGSAAAHLLFSDEAVIDLM